MKPSSILEKVHQKTAEEIKKTVSPTLQIGQFEKIVKEFAKYVMEVNVCLKLHKKYIQFL